MTRMMPQTPGVGGFMRMLDGRSQQDRGQPRTDGRDWPCWCDRRRGLARVRALTYRSWRTRRPGTEGRLAANARRACANIDLRRRLELRPVHDVRSPQRPPHWRTKLLEALEDAVLLPDAVFAVRLTTRLQPRRPHDAPGRRRLQADVSLPVDGQCGPVGLGEGRDRKAISR
jgi:hypothetical protein